jgi:hypothetical protein
MTDQMLEYIPCTYRLAMDVSGMKLVGVVTRRDLRSTSTSTMDTPSSQMWAAMDLFYHYEFNYHNTVQYIYMQALYDKIVSTCDFEHSKPK